MTTPEPTAEAVALWNECYVAVYGCATSHPAYMYANAHVLIDAALQAERDKERGSVVAWLGKRAESLTVHPDATEADRQRADFAKEVIAIFAEAVRINKHRGTEHV